MPSQSAGETKKAVCRSFTNVIKASRLKGSVDPKAFFMMVNTNFPVLFRDGTIDLNPIWEALSTTQPPEALYSVFLKFAESADQLELKSILPPSVAALDETQRREEMLGFSPSGDSVDVVTGESGSFPSLDALPAQDLAPEDLRLATGDLAPFIPEDVRRQVTQHVVYAVKGAPVGRLVDAHQLAFLVDSDFEHLFNGQLFDFNPILDGLRKLGDFKDDDVYVAVVRLEHKLQGMGFGLTPVSLQVDPAAAAKLVQEAQTRDRQAAQEAANAVAATRAAAVSQVPEIGEPVEDPEKGDEKKTRKAKSLEKYSIKSKGSRRALVIRHVVLAVIAVSLAVTAFLTRPNRPLNTDDYEASIPLTNAKLENGSLIGTLDDTKWWTLEFEQRKKRFKAFTVFVEARGEVRYLQVRDGTGRLVIASGRGGQVVPAKFFMYGSEDGTISDEQREAMEAEAPANAKRVLKKDEKK